MFPQRLIEPERRDTTREDPRLYEGDKSRFCHALTILLCSMHVKPGITGRVKLMGATLHEMGSPTVA